MNLDIGSLGPSPMKTRSGKGQKEKKEEREKVGGTVPLYGNTTVVKLKKGFCQMITGRQLFEKLTDKAEKNALFNINKLFHIHMKYFGPSKNHLFFY